MITTTAAIIGTAQATSTGLARDAATSTGIRHSRPTAMAMFSTGTQPVRFNAVSTPSCRPDRQAPSTATPNAAAQNGPDPRNCRPSPKATNPNASSTETPVEIR